LLAVLSGGGCSGVVIGAIENRGAPGQSINIEVPRPGLFPPIQFHDVVINDEKSIRFAEVCLPEGEVDGGAWERSFWAAGFKVQVVRWRTGEPIGVRFRRGDVVGDVYSPQPSRLDKIGCRRFHIRVQRTGKQMHWQWKSRYMDAPSPSGWCVPVFRESSDFPFAPEMYCY
jgi:hypothetical protein